MLTEEDRKRCLDELKKYKIVLDRDPSVSGLSSCYQNISLLEEFKNRVSDILTDAIADLINAKKMVVDAKFEYDQMHSKQSSEDNIKILKSSDLRETAVKVLLGNYLRAIARSEKELLDATGFHNKVNLAYSELSDKIDAIKQQVNIYNTMYRRGEDLSPRIPHSEKIRVGLE